MDTVTVGSQRSGRTRTKFRPASHFVHNRASHAVGHLQSIRACWGVSTGPSARRARFNQLFNQGARAVASCRNKAGSGMKERTLGRPDSESRSMRMSDAAPD